MNDSPTIQSVIESCAEDLKSYLEAQYHVRDEAALRERRALLDDGSTIAQIPFLESTPSYQLTDSYDQLTALPPKTKALLTSISNMGAGLYPRPYFHQAEALEAFIAHSKNVIAATGTGSGKTEIFLLSILASLAEESSLGTKVTTQSGCRALILYPMNALVSDQLSRLRLLFGNSEVAGALRKLRGRTTRFAMYTSRTPFPGLMGTQQNQKRAKSLLDNRYRPILDDLYYLERLKKRGKWPAKDVEKFFGRPGQSWAQRLRTASDDAELLMRHEIQEDCPEILVTNYSMLEYMMVRPIERTIFDQTRSWLASDPNTFFTVVLDEAHMYRGATGAEVSFLLRRLLQRIDIPRDRVRFILTTASVGSGPQAKEAAMNFACDLTSLPRESRDQFAYIQGSRESFSSARPATQQEAEVLASFDSSNLQGNLGGESAQRIEVSKMMAALGQSLASTLDLSDSLYSALTNFSPAGQLVNLISGDAQPLTQVAKSLFPGCNEETTNSALDSLIRLCNFAKESATGKVFLPARIHMFFRGLSGLYSCVDPKCPGARVQSVSPLLGRMYSEPRVLCDCGGRVFEVLTHRDCGAFYLRCFVDEHPRPNFAWHEPTTQVRADNLGTTLRLVPMHLLVARTRPDFAGWQPAWLQISSGRLARTDPASDAWLQIYLPDDSHARNANLGGRLFGICPSCNQTTQRNLAEPSKIMDLQTKGEQPFGQLIKRQLFSQAADLTKPVNQFPNQGRKTLIFSDGRQKAARLAKSLPEEVEADAFRELLTLGYSLIRDSKSPESIPLSKAYLIFVAACSEANVVPYSGDDYQKLLKDMDSFEKTFGKSLQDWYEDGPSSVPGSFLQNLYRQAGGGLYSLRFICAGSIWPNKRSMNRVFATHKDIPRDTAIALALIWIQDLARKVAIDKSLSRAEREAIQGFRGGQSWAHDGRFNSRMRDVIVSLGFDLQALQNTFIDVFAVADTNGGYYLEPEAVALLIDLERHWFRCQKCKSDSLLTLNGLCLSCGCPNVDDVDPASDAYIRTRKGFWRQPLVEVRDGSRKPRLLKAEEHTAQLSHNDPKSGSTVIEDFELRFQDILRDREKPIDVLSCTTTMEAGVDIGSLEAVGLRNVPPQRENYQQRAGRAGRRGSAISTVITYCQGNPHDNYYFQNVNLIASGSPRDLIVKSNNPKIARRHVHAYLLQEFFGTRAGFQANANILSSLGGLGEFYAGDDSLSKDPFRAWIRDSLSTGLGGRIAKWIGSLRGIDNLEEWATLTCEHFSEKIEGLAQKAQEISNRERLVGADEKTDFLAFLLDEALLPSYAFATDLSAFQVEDVAPSARELTVLYRPNQSAARALTEYAPGRIITINKQDYLSAAVVANSAVDESSRALALFENPHRRPYVFCSETSCCYVEDARSTDASTRTGVTCPLCSVGSLVVMDLISPEVYLPEGSSPISKLDEDPDITRATPAQFPVPIHQENEGLESVGPLSGSVNVFRREQAELVVVNKGDPEDQTGFIVCRMCGLARVKDRGVIPQQHKTPYCVQESRGRSPGRRNCSGQVENVFLGHRFSTDLSIVRANISPPLCQNPHGQGADFLALQSALQTIAEALTLGAAKHFDVDYSEFSAGYRLIQNASTSTPFVAEIYMFDTLSGGAGYSQQLADVLEVVLRNHVFEILRCSESDGTGCDRSCHKCLRHYHNQFHHTIMDRFLARDLLRFLLDGEGLENPDGMRQQELLRGLADMLTFDGIEIELNTTFKGFKVPLLAKKGNRTTAVYVTHSLVAPSDIKGLISHQIGGCSVCPLNEFFLSRNLPGSYLQVKRHLGD